MNTQDIFDICLAKKLAGGGSGGTYEDKTLTPDFSNGDVVVEPDEGYDALSSVTIEKDPDLLAGNIKKDVEVFGIIGTLENTIPQDLQTEMNSVFNEKFQTSIDYPPEEWAATVELMEPYPSETTSGSVANFSTSLTLPLVSHSVTIEPVQEGTGDPSPSNVRPISGHMECEVTQTGKNLFDLDNLTGTGITISSGVASGIIGDFYGNFKNSQGGIPNLSNFKADTQYTLSLWYKYENNSYSGNGLGIRVNYTDGTNNDLFYTKVQTADYSLITGTTTAGKTVKNLAINYGTGAGTTIFLKDIQLEEGSTATTYEAYTGQTYTRTFLDSNDDPVTVYGGSENLKTGEGGANGFIDLGDPSLTWQQSATATEGKYRFSTPLTGAAITPTVSTISDVTCEIAPAGSPVSTYSNVNGVAISNTSSTLIIYIEEYSGYTAADFKTAVTGHKLVYPLATPIPFHTDPLNLDTLEGVNNIWADTGDTAVEFKLTHQDWVDQHTSPEPNLLTRSAPEEVKEETEEELLDKSEEVDMDNR